MNEFIVNIWSKIKELNSRLELRQKLVLGSLSVATISVLVWLILWSTKTDYAMLYGNLELNSASEISQKLDEKKVKYKLTNQGQTILVPRELVYKTRMELASDGINLDTVTGYEIFEKSSLGMTEFVQNVNYKRAVEGELRRTIEAINGIDQARVHLVFPEEKIFKEDQKDPSASVSLMLKKRLTENQISGISTFIAGAVEGLEIYNITIIDQDGNTLTERYDSSITGLSSKQLELQLETEKRLTTKVQTMLNQVVGANNSVVRITAELNFDQVQTTSEQYDPESKVVRSEEVESSSEDNMSDSITVSSEHLITNYDINKTIQTISKQIGDIKRLTVSVTLNYKLNIKEEEGTITREYVERTENEISSLAEQVKNAVGFNQTRGDEVVVTSVEFDNTEQNFVEQQESTDRQREQIIHYAERGVILVVLISLVFILITQFKKIFAVPEEPEEVPVRPTLIEGSAETEGFYEEGEEGMPMGEGKITYTFQPMKDVEINQTESLQLQEAVRNFILQNPEAAAKLIKSWLLDKREVQ